MAVAHTTDSAQQVPRSRTAPGQRTLVGSTHAVCLCTGARGHTTARSEWELAFSRQTDRIEAGKRVSANERIRFRADAAQLRCLAMAMLAGARELEAIETHMHMADPDQPIDLDYLETITLTEHGVGPSYESPLYVDPGS